MNRTQLRNEVSLWAEKSDVHDETERPGDADIRILKELWGLRKTPSVLSAAIPSNIGVIYDSDPDWNSWPSITARFKAYQAALVDMNNRLSSSMAAVRLGGV
jgi:hypothetical protein